MFEYLLDYGVKKHQVDYEDIDINDRLLLQEQINKARKNYASLLELLDDVQGKYIDCSSKMARKAKDLIQGSPSSKRDNSLFTTDEDYLELEAEQLALKTGMSMINAQLDFYKNDLRILNSVFYNKF